jgi:fluoride exporter
MAWFGSLSIGLRLAVAAGGVVGAATRLGLLELLGYRGAGLLVAIAVANVVGSAGVGATVAAAQRWHWPPTVRTTLVVGVCGGLTTFSTVSLEVARSLHDATGPGATVAAVGYAVGSMVVCVAAVWAGRAGVMRAVVVPS